MKRTQIFIEEDIYKYLQKESDFENKTVSEIIRKSLREMLMYKTNNIIKHSNKIFGIWKNRKMDVEHYINNIREDRNI